MSPALRHNDAMALLAILIGIVTGVVSGLIGLGGGLLIVPALVYIFKMPQHLAQGTSLATLLLPIGLFGFLEYYRRGQVDVRIAIFLALGFVAGAFVGASWAQDVSGPVLRRAFSITLAVVAIRMWFE